jgi:hypothetical protein
MSKPAAPTPLEAARAELARRKQRRDADLARFGPAHDGDPSSRNRHLRQRFAAHQELIDQAAAAVSRLQVADALDKAKAEVQVGIDEAAADLKARQADVQRAVAALDEVTARAKALEGQIAQLQAGRFTGLDTARGALTACTAADDQAGAAAAAEEVARIETEAASVDARTRPLQLQLDAVGGLKTAAEARIEKARHDEDLAAQALTEANLQALAIVRDEAAIAFREAHAAFVAADNRPTNQRKNLHVEFSIGASPQVLKALANAPHELILVTGLTLQRAEQTLRTSEAASEALFAVDPLTLEDMATWRAKSDAEAAARRAETAHA